MKKNLLTLLAFAAAAIAGAAHAQGTFPPPPPLVLTGPYVGATFGLAQARNGCTGIIGGGGRACDDKDPAWGFFAGYQVNRWLGAELAYRDLGFIRSTSATSSLHTHTSAWDLTALGFVPLEDRFSVYGKFGAYRASLESSENVADAVATGLTYGAGLQWDFRRGFGARAQWQRYRKVDGGHDYGENIYDVLSAAVFWRFR
jgi:OmpA-OmpF porin, OOP family